MAMDKASTPKAKKVTPIGVVRVTAANSHNKTICLNCGTTWYGKCESCL